MRCTKCVAWLGVAVCLAVGSRPLEAQLSEAPSSEAPSSEAPSSEAPSSEAPSLEELRRTARVEVYVPPSDEEVLHAAQSFEELLRRGSTQRALDGLARLGLERFIVNVNEELVTVIREAPGDRRGWGVYAFRVAAVSNILLQAPHSFADLHSGSLVERVFVEQNVRAAAWNTASRRAEVLTEGNEKTCQEGDCADLAHVDNSLFQAFTLAFAKTYPGGRVIQLHGFSTSARKTPEGRRSEVVVSNGQRRPQPWLWSIDQCLEDRLCDVTSVFPEEVRELGALTNRQGRLLRERKHDGFLHVELALPLRKQLKGDRLLRRELWRCLREGVR